MGLDTNEMRLRFLEAIRAPLGRAEVVAVAKRCAAAGGKAAPEDRMRVAGTLAHAAFLAPDRTADMYDALAEGWLGAPVKADPIRPLDRGAEAEPDGLWDEYWDIVEDGFNGNLDALSITQRTAGLGKYFTSAALARVAEAAHRFDGVTEAAAGPMPELIELSTLAACPKGSLGGEFHDLIVDNKFDLEVLDRDAIGVEALPQPLAWLNTRMLQAHDLWHITAGYETTSLHEIAISAFQMAQFGHNYSAQFLSITAVIGALVPAKGYPVLMDTIATAWVHGRETAPMILIPWEEVWDQPVDTIRKAYGIAPYERQYPADLIERNQAFMARIEPLLNVLRWLAAPFRGRLQPG